MIANEIELEPLHEVMEGGAPLATSVLPFLEAVTVNVEVHLGSATLSLARLMQMKAGAVIGLDRTLVQPVDVRIGDQLVARGSLVAVGDQFGVRLLEAVNPGSLMPRASE